MSKVSDLKKILLFPLLFSISQIQANDFGSAIKNTSVSGLVRAGYINVNPDIAGNKTTSATAIAAQLKLETGIWHGLQIGVAPYVVQKISDLSGDKSDNELNGDFFDRTNDSYAYLGEAYLNYSRGAGSLRIGRQLLDNPFINTDDIRSHPNTFDAVWLNYRFSDALNIEAGKVKRWAGFDSGASQEKFKKASNDGVVAIGASYQLNQNQAYQAWYYDFDNSHQQVYFDLSYTRGDLEAGFQYSNFNESNNSSVDGAVYGVSIAYTIDKLSLNAAFNEVSNGGGQSVSNGLGGGNFFTSMDELTIDGINDASSYLIGADYSVSDNLSISLAFGHFKDGKKITSDIDETDLVVNYAINDKTDVEYIYADVSNDAAPADVDTNFKRQVLRVNYQF